MADSNWPFGRHADEPREGGDSGDTAGHENQAGGHALPARPPSEERPSARTRFRRWRRSRPFWGGLITMLGGLEVMIIPLTAYKIILVSPSVSIGAAVGAVILIFGILTLMSPPQNKLYGLLAVLGGVLSFVTSNLGGFVIGAILSILGGALTFAWTVLPEQASGTPEGQAPEQETPPDTAGQVDEARP